MDTVAIGPRSLGIEGRLAMGVVLERLTGRHTSTHLGRYLLREQLGAGGCGVVFSAFDPKLQRPVAIKVLLPAADARENVTQARARLLREAQALARLRHRNIVEVFDVGVDAASRGSDRVYLVMELLSGRTLEAWVAQDRPAWPEILARWCTVIDGIAAAHDAGIIHRDIKPANAMATDDGRIKVLDFGLARAHRIETDPMSESDPSLDDMSLTLPGMVMGTPRYMAPEQHAGEEVTEHTDQFSLCACIFEALYGAPPYPGKTLDEIAEQKHRGPPPRPRGHDVPAAVYAVLARGLDPRPQRRFETVRTLAQALRRARRRRRRPLAVASLVGLVAVSGTMVWAAEPTPPPECDAPSFAWDEARQAEVRRGAVIAGDAAADRAWTNLRNRVETARGRFDTVRTEACASGAAPTAASADALWCVARSEQEIDAALDGLREAGERGADPRTSLRRLFRWTGKNPCAGQSRHLGTTAERVELDRIATELEAHGRRLAADRVDVTLAFVEQSLPRVDELGDASLRARLLELRGKALGGAGQYRQAADALVESIWIAEGEGDLVSAADLVPTALHHLIESGAPAEEIERLERLGLDLAARADEPSSASAELDVMRGLARIRRRELDEAEQMFLSAERVGSSVPMGTVATTRARLGLSGVYLMRGEPEPARHYAQLVLDDPPPVRGVRSGALEEAHSRMGMLAFEGGDLDEAQVHFEAILASIEGELGDGHPALAQPLCQLGDVMVHRGEGEAGIAKMQGARDLALATVGWEHPMLGHILNALALAEAARGNLEEAAELATQTREHAALHNPEDSPEVIDAEVLHAEILAQLERFDEARPLIERALEYEGDQARASLLHAAALLALSDGDATAAEGYGQRALARLSPMSPSATTRGSRGDVVRVLARARLALGDREGARALAAHAITLLTAGDPWQRAHVAEVETWIDDALV